MKSLRKPFPKWWTIVLVCTSVAYSGAYGVARSAGVLIHYSGYITDASGARVVESHRVGAGDRRFDFTGPVSAAAFTPIRWGETIVWYALRPRGTQF